TAVLPRLLRGRDRLRIWSAGCSYGAEPYTLALVLASVTPGKQHHILATDVDQRVLDRARLANSYTDQDVRNVPGVLRRRFFTRGCDERWVLDPLIRSAVTFRRHDLLKDTFDREIDLIVCRNVVIYFTDDAKRRLYQKFHDALRPGGYLFVGGTEVVTGAVEMGFTNDLPTFYLRRARTLSF
ncbi:MAG: CheR family methyltransferase, partial [Chloroflexota bacterium]